MSAPHLKLPRTISSRLYLAAALATMAVLSIAVASLYFTHRTRLAVQHFHSEALPGLLAAADLALLLEQHRRIIETVPVVMDRYRIDRDRRHSEALIEQIGALVGRGDSRSAEIIRVVLPTLLQSSRRVLELAADYAQQQAMEEAESYSGTARTIEEAIATFRASSLASAQQGVSAVASGGQQLAGWVMAGTVAIAVALPLALWLLHYTLLRLRLISRAMLRLAQNETDLHDLPADDGDEVGDMARAVSVFRDNAMLLMEQRTALLSLNQRLDIALANMSHGLSMFDSNQRLLVSNARYSQIYNLPPHVTVAGTSFAEIIGGYRAQIDDNETETVSCDAWCGDMISRIGTTGFTDFRRLHDGRLIQITYRPIEGGGWVDVHEDITEKKAAEERIARLAREDTLTGVANRHAFREALQASLGTGTACPPFAIHWIDLDRFKEVNDVHGHPAGDALLVAVASRIGNSVRSTDFVARLGGDEFAVIQRDAGTSAEAEPLALRLIEVLSAPYMIAGHSMSIGASIGIALSIDAAGDGQEALLRNADVALYQAKAAGRGTHVLFRTEFEELMRERRQLEADLRCALARSEFELHYQPIIDLAGRHIKSCETLLRWQHPVRGMISPTVFIPIAEELGLISEIGAWVLDQACADATTWPGGVSVAVNLSAAQFESDDVLSATERALTRTGLAPSRLELEVTESLLLKDRTETRRVLHQLRALGVAIALDDFGTGYASLSYLRSFPFDKIKIDQTFVRELPEQPQCLAIVSAICELARSLDMRTVAEGVETPEQVEWIERAGCNEAQGYLYSPPVPAAELPAVLLGCDERLRAAA